MVLVGRALHRDLPGVRLLREPVPDHDVTSIKGVPLTTPERTIFDCLRLLPTAQGRDLLDRALQAGWITADNLAARVQLHAGRRDAPRLARLSRDAGAGTHSAAERLAGTLLRRARIGGWVANAEIFDEADRLIGVGDLVFRDVRLVVEIDGRAHHTTPDRFERDRRRQNRLVAAGWTVLRFTWRDLTTRPTEVVATITTMLTQLHRRDAARPP